MAIDRWCAYLQHKPFLIRTNQRSLIHLADHRISTPIQQKAYLKLMGFQYRVVYKKGAENRAADVLSRRLDTEDCVAISEVRPHWLKTVLEGYEKDPDTKKLILNSNNSRGFVLSDGVIRYNGRVWLGSHNEAHDVVLQALHNSGLEGTQAAWQHTTR